MTISAKTEPARSIIAITDSALAELEAVLAASGELTLHGDDEHDWTARDVWAHLGRWLAAADDAVRRYLAGERAIDDYDDSATLNLTWIAEDGQLDLDAARRRAVDAWGRLRDQIADLEDDRWNKFIQAYAQGNGGGHIVEHIKYITEARADAAPAEALQRLDRDRWSWGSLVAALDARPGVPLHDPESPDWTSQEIFGHFAHWTEWGITAFEAQLAGNPRPESTETADEVNTRWAAEDRSLDLEALRARALAAFGQRAQLIASTPADRWTASMLATVAEDGYDHIAEHLRYIGAGSSE